MKKILFIISLLSIIIKVNAQHGGHGGPPAIGVVSGIVKGDNGELVEYATIALKSVKDSSIVTGGITDATGKFLIEEIKLGKYTLIVQFIGFEGYESDVFSLGREGVKKDFGFIKLESKGDLAVVEAQAEEQMLQTSIDKKVFNADKSITSAGGTALDVLRNVPSVQVDQDGGVSLRGNSNVTVLIDGKPSGLTGASRQALLDQLPASSIENIEVITNPSAKYDPDGMSGIINITLKKNKLKGFTGSTGVTVGTRDKYNFTGGLNFKNKKWNLSSNYTYNYRDNLSRNVTARDALFNDDTIGFRQKSNSTKQRQSHMLKLGVDYNLNDKNSVSLGTTLSKRGHEGDGLLEYEDLLNGNHSLYRNRENLDSHGGNNIDFKAGYSHDFKKPKQKITVDITHSESDHDKWSNSTEDYLDEKLAIISDDVIAQNTTTYETNQISTAQFDLVYPINDKLNIETGYKSIFREIDNDFYSESFDTNSVIVEDVLLSNRFKYNEEIHAGYAIAGYKFTDKLSVQAGARVEETNTTSTLVNTNNSFTNNYFNIFPSGYVNYAFDKYTTLNASYSKRINRPSFHSLNPFTNYSNPQLLRVGNPFLNPEYIDSYELSYSKYTKSGIALNPSVYYKHTIGVIQRVVFVDSNNVSTVRRENVGKNDAVGVEMVFSGKIKPFWRMTVSANVYKSYQVGAVSANEGNVDLNNEAFGGNGSFINNFTIKKNTSIQVVSWGNLPILFAQGRIKQMGSVELAIKQKIWKGKADISLRLSDVFNTQRFAIDLDEPTYISSTFYKWESRNVYAGFTYRFGKLEAQGHRRRGGKKKKGNEGDFNAGDGGGGM